MTFPNINPSTMAVVTVLGHLRSDPDPDKLGFVGDPGSPKSWGVAALKGTVKIC